MKTESTSRDARCMDPTEVQFFLDNLGTHRLFDVIFIKKNGEQRQLRGWLEPTDKQKTAVAVRLATDEENPDNVEYRSFCKDRVLSLHEVTALENYLDASKGT